MAEMGGEGPPAATLCLPLPEDLSGEDRQLSEQERSNLPSACARGARSGRKSWEELLRAGKTRAAGNASSRERREEGAVRVGGDGAGAGGHSSPTPGPGSAALGAGRRRERGARGRGREECDREGARGAGARLCGGAHGERGNVEPELPS